MDSCASISRGRRSFILSNRSFPHSPSRRSILCSWITNFVADGVGAEADILHRLTAAIEAPLCGWRSARHYFNPFGADRILREGHGQLLSGPQPMTESCRSVLEAAGIHVRCLPGGQARWPRQVLVAGKNFVVAKSFRIVPDE